jgi:hypothetical protein
MGHPGLYIHQNPVMAKLVANASGYRYCSAFPGFKLDAWPQRLKPDSEWELNRHD